MPSRPWGSLGLRPQDPPGPGGHYFLTNNALAGILIIIFCKGYYDHPPTHPKMTFNDKYTMIALTRRHCHPSESKIRKVHISLAIIPVFFYIDGLQIVNRYPVAMMQM